MFPNSGTLGVPISLPGYPWPVPVPKTCKFDTFLGSLSRILALGSNLWPVARVLALGSNLVARGPNLVPCPESCPLSRISALCPNFCPLPEPLPSARISALCPNLCPLPESLPFARNCALCPKLGPLPETLPSRKLVPCPENVPCARKQKADSTLRYSQAVPDPSTNRALSRLTSEVERDPVHSTRYGRQRDTLNLLHI